MRDWRHSCKEKKNSNPRPKSGKFSKVERD
jgi:hypothetical protein